jgi:hypothetical protein
MIVDVGINKAAADRDVVYYSPQLRIRSLNPIAKVLGKNTVISQW